MSRSDPVAAKAAAIETEQARPPTWQTVIKRALVLAIAGVAIYLVLPSLIAVPGSWPRLSALGPAWFAVALAAEVASFTCNFALQRLALRTRGWFAVVTAGLAGNAVTNSLPGGDAAGAAVQFGMLTTHPRPALVLLAYSTAGVVALLPLTPGGLGIVEASLGGLLILAGVHPRDALLATLVYRVASYWLPLLTGPLAYLLFRHRYGTPAPSPAEGPSPRRRRWSSWQAW